MNERDFIALGNQVRKVEYRADMNRIFIQMLALVTAASLAWHALPGCTPPDTGWPPAPDAIGTHEAGHYDPPPVTECPGWALSYGTITPCVVNEDGAKVAITCFETWFIVETDDIPLECRAAYCEGDVSGLCVDEQTPECGETQWESVDEAPDGASVVEVCE